MSLLDLLLQRETNEAPKVRAQQDYTDIAAEILSKSGIVDPRVYDKNIQFKGVAPSESARGLVAYVEPHINPRATNLVAPNWSTLWENPLTPVTLAHETEHKLAYSGGAELNKLNNRGLNLLDNYWKLKNTSFDAVSDETKFKPWMDLSERASNTELKKHIRDKYGLALAYIGNDSGPRKYFPRHFEEIAADLGTLSKLSRKDIFADPVLQEKLFGNDPYLMEAVRASINVEPRMDAKDLQRLTAYPQNVERFKKMLRKASGGAVSLPDEFRRGGRVRMI